MTARLPDFADVCPNVSTDVVLTINGGRFNKSLFDRVMDAKLRQEQTTATASRVTEPR